MEPRDEDKETGRVEAFSDGVIAIAITLLILEIKVPKVAEIASVGLLRKLAGPEATAATAFYAGTLTWRIRSWMGSGR